jgi:fructose/tagatose bisphosphate aldolase
MKPRTKPLFTRPLPAFNFNDQHDLAAIVGALEQCGRPGIAMVSMRAASYYELELLFEIFAFYRRKSSIPLWIELDHCADLSMLRRAAVIQFDILMADFSHLPLEDNIKTVAGIVREMRSFPCLIEGESSPIPADVPMKEDYGSLMPSALAHKFVAETGCDLVAPNLGTLHGFKRRKPAIDKRFVEEIVRAVSVPVVAHGCDYLTSHDISVLCETGVRKLNFGPQLRDIWCTACRAEWQRSDTDRPDQRSIHHAANDALRSAISGILGSLR